LKKNYIKKVDEKYVLNWLVVWFSSILLHQHFDRLWPYEKLKLYSYTLGLYQLENTIILIDVLLSCTCDSILQNCDTYFPILAFQKIYLNAY
jgi:hypothetical protein